MDSPIVNPEIERYLHELQARSEPVLAELERRAQDENFPIVGPLVGRLLFVLARSLRAQTVLELGSGFGYSGLWFAKALEDGGRVVMTEGQAHNVESARDYFRRAGLVDRAVFEQGDALEIVQSYPGPFDVIFCDIDKKDYPRALDLALPRLRRGGLLIYDNVLWSGRAAREAAADDVATLGVRELNRRLHQEPSLSTTILPLRDGVSVSVKL